MKSYLDQLRRFSSNARLFLLFILLSFLGDGLFLVLYNLYLLQLGFREDFIGTFVALSALGAGLWALPAGVLTDRFGRKGVLLLGTGLLALAHLGQSMLINPPLLLALSFLCGVGMALYWVPRGPFLTANSSLRERTHLFTLALVAEEATVMMAGLVGGQLPTAFAWLFPGVTLHSVWPYRCTLLLGTAFIVVGMIPLLLIQDRPVDAPQAVEGPFAAGPQVWEARWPWGIIGALALVEIIGGIGGWMVSPFFNVYFAKELGASTAQVGYLFFTNGVLTIGGALVAPVVAHGLGQVRTMVLARLASVPLTASLAIFSNRLKLAAAAYLGRNMMFFVGIPVTGAFSMEVVPPRLQATTSSIRHTMRGLSRTVGSFLAGQLIVARGYPSVFALSSGLVLLSAVVLYGYFHGVERGVLKETNL